MTSSERSRAYYLANRERLIANQIARDKKRSAEVSAYKKMWWERNRERMKRLKAEHYLANRETLLAKFKEAYAANPGPAKARARAYAQANHDVVIVKMREQGKRYREQYPDRVRERHRLYGLAKPEKRRQITARRRARERAARVDPSVDYSAVLKAFTGSCGICRKPLDINSDKYHFDHIVPIAVGGSHDASNLQIAHARCNLAKGKKAA